MSDDAENRAEARTEPRGVRVVLRYPDGSMHVHEHWGATAWEWGTDFLYVTDDGDEVRSDIRVGSVVSVSKLWKEDHRQRFPERYAPRPSRPWWRPW